MSSTLKQRLAQNISTQLQSLLPGQMAVPAIVLERPKQAEHGDLACNVALQLAKPLQKNPRELAALLVERLLAHNADGLLASAEVAGPGFINFRLSPAAKQEIVRTVLQAGARFGHGTLEAGKKVMVEFVSANPTGPLHVGHGRQAALGDALCHLLAAQGAQVTREFYYNDAGNQIDNLTLSVHARVLGKTPEDADWPADGYRGDYISDIARDYLARKSVHADDRSTTASGDVNNLDNIREFAVAYLRHEQDLDLQAFGVKFDHYYLESSLYTDGKVDAAVAALRAHGKTYEQDGALWLKTTAYGDDKDRVMRKSEGGYTYFVPDVAYHITKWQRGYAKVINVQGTDHHGTIARVRAGLQAVEMNIPQGYPDYVLHSMVKVMRGGEEVKISKRAGSYVTVRDLIDWVGRDAVRFFLVSRKADTEFVFDIDLALSQSEENPVFYVQYAHARICSVLAQWGGELQTLPTVELAPLTSARETSLMNTLAAYPEVVQQATAELAPHHVAFYLKELASEFHSYYNAERVLIEAEPVKQARLALYLATRQVLQNGLALLGVSAPERMDRRTDIDTGSETE
ncbi:MAG: arginine--tRNA ligase [Burkholderiaceae bacterium]|nr:MAG: arginine--tRNA ligase [Burkholderiaceae bacterium]